VKTILLLAAFIITSITGFTQTIINGKVKDAKGRPVAGASVSIKDSYDGATADSTGRFLLKTTEKGEQVLIATSIGFKLNEQKVNMQGSKQTIDIILKEEPNELNAVVVTAGAFEASDSKRTTVLNSLDIVTTASANADVTSALKTLPGAQQVGESEGLFVRGGSAGESKIFIDGTQVNNFFYSSVPGIASRGRFNPFLFKGTIFSTGGYSALYGQALSSALILESIDLPERSSADAGITFLSGDAGFQQLAKNKNASYGLTYGYTNLGLAFNLIKQRQQYYRAPLSHEGDANFRIKTSKTGIIKYYGYIYTSKLGLRQPSLDSINMKDLFDLQNFNTYHNLSWKEKLGKKWKMFAGISYSNNKDDIRSEFQNAANQKQIIINPVFYAFKNFNLTSKGNFLQSRLYVERRLAGLSTLRFGGEHSYSNEKAVYTLYTGQSYTETVKENLTAGYTEADVYITNDIAVKAGGRIEYSQLLNKANIAPRLSLAYKFNDGSQAGFAYGIFYQNPERRLLPVTIDVDFAKATHYILQYQKASKDYTFRAETFYKKYDDLFKTGFNQNNVEKAINNNGFGDAKGFELFWRDRKTIKNLDYWISYSYLDTKRDFQNFPMKMQPSFATAHTASFITKKFVVKWKTGFNLAYNFATGRPYYRIAYNNNNSKFELTDKGKTINYNNLSFSLNYLPFLGNTKTKTFAVLVFSINNILGQNQVYNYNYSYDGSRKQAVVPPSRRFFFIGCFLSFGVDRSEDVINNNL
jgi:vitamin B12 transporter